MSTQPIPNKIKASNPELCAKKFNTLLVDGSNLLEVCFNGYKKLSSSGKEIGAIYQFLLQLKLLLRKGNFRYVYCFFDGDSSGQYRFNYYPDYKANRDKTFDEEELSDYMKEVNERIRRMQKHYNKPKRDESEKENFFWQRNVLMECLEELAVRQCICDKVEADDLIGYYVTHKKPEERIVICSNDRDLTQLISEDVIVYVQSLHDFVNTKNHTSVMGYHYSNVLLKKILCGDTSDNIKGVKGLGEKTLFQNFPELTERRVTLNEVIAKASGINEKRKSEKKKPLKWAENIVNCITDGIQGNKLYEINEKIIDLKHPLMTDEAIELMEAFMYAPMDMEGRSIENLYRILLENEIDDLKDEGTFANFFMEFKYLIEKETRNMPN